MFFLVFCLGYLPNSLPKKLIDRKEMAAEQT